MLLMPLDSEIAGTATMTKKNATMATSATRAEPMNFRMAVASVTFMCAPSNVAKSEHVGHRIKSRLLRARPEGRVQRAARENHAVLGLVHQFDALGGPGKNHAVLADHAAAAQGRKADIARLARAGVAVAAFYRMLVELDAAAFRRRAGKQQRRDGRGLGVLG